MKKYIRPWFIRLILYALLCGAILCPCAAGAEPAGAAEWPAAVRDGAKSAWNEACGQFGRIAITSYSRDMFVDEGSGTFLPYLCTVKGNYYLVVLVQQEDTSLVQVIYRIHEDGWFQQVFEEQVFTLGGRERLCLYSQSGSSLISAAFLEMDVAAFVVAPSLAVEKHVYHGNENAESIADMSAVPLQAFETIYGDPDWDILVDANYGLFHLEIRDTQTVREILGVDIP